MRTAMLAKNNVLFGILFAALGLDLAGRLGSTQEMVSSDFASQAAQECSKLIESGIINEGQAGCMISFKGTTTEARVRKVTKGPDGISSDWSAPKTPAVPYTEAEIKKPELATCPTKKGSAKTNCEKRNAELEKVYKEKVEAREARLRERNKKAPETPQGKPSFEVNVQTTAEGCADCYARETVAMSTGDSPDTIAAKILEMSKKQSDALKKAKNARERLEKDIENCARGEDGVALKSSERMTCQMDKMTTGERKESRKHFASLRSSLNQMILSGNDEEREEALEMSRQIARDSSLPRDIRESARVMTVGGKYLKQIESITESLNKAPANSAARIFHMQRLMGLQHMIQTEFGFAMNGLMRQGINENNAGTLDEISSWMGTLQNSLSLATNSVNSFGASGQLNLDIGQTSRTLRGIPGETLLNTQQQFNNLNVQNGFNLQNQIQGGLQNQQNILHNVQNGNRYGPGTLVQNTRVQTPPNMISQPPFNPGTQQIGPGQMPGVGTPVVRF